MTAMEEIPRKPYAMVMLIACAASIALGIGIAAIAGAAGEHGGDQTRVMLAIGLTMLAGLSLCALPLAGPPLVTAERWGLMVLMASVGRTLLVLSAMVVLVEALGLPRQAIGYGLLSGALLMMFAEAGIAVHLLMKRERLRESSRGVLHPAANPSVSAPLSSQAAVESGSVSSGSAL